MKKYQIWDKESNIYTPIGEELTPEMWINRYAWIKVPTAVPVIANGVINGAFCGELSEMKALCEANGAIFEDNLTNDELLAEIETFENGLSTSTTPSTNERIAAALEAQVMMSLPDEEITEEA